MCSWIVLCSSRFIFISFHVTRVQFWWRAFIFVLENNSSYHLIFMYVWYISCRVVKRQKRTVFDTHILHATLCYTKFNNAFVLLFVHECLRDTQTFWCLCTKILILHHTHTQYLYTHFIQTFHTHKYKTQNVFEKIPSTFYIYYVWQFL